MVDVSHINTRRIRKERNLTLKQLSELCGLSVSYLSKYENNQTSITVASLSSIAQALDVPIKVLIAPEDEEDILIVRRNERFSVIQNRKHNTVQEFLTSGSLFDMQVTVMHMPPFSSSGELGSHDGEEFLFILEGKIQLTIEGRQPIKLEEGDMAYYFPRYSHGWENITDKKALFLAVTTKNGF